MSKAERQDEQTAVPGCNVSSTLNFTIGAIAIVAALAIAIGTWVWLR